jgi:hypothetical protein
MTSERVCGTHPSDRSPRTAVQDGAEGDSLHICTGGESARAVVAADKPQAAPNKISAQFNSFRMSANSLLARFIGIDYPIRSSFSAFRYIMYLRLSADLERLATSNMG